MAHYAGTRQALGRLTEAHKISKAERTPMAHTERTGIAPVPRRAHRSHAVPRTGKGIG